MFLTTKTEDLELLLDSAKICFDVIAITETRILKNNFPVTHINLTNYSYEHFPAESSAEGTLLYIGDRLSYKPRNDWFIYKTAELEATFIKLINTKKTNATIGAIYRHLNMNLDKFNGIYFNRLLDKISKESKSIFLFHDFSVDTKV